MRPPGGKNEFLIAPERAGQREVDDDERRQERRPEPESLTGPQPEEDDRDDDEHQDARARDGRRAGGAEHERAEPPPALPVAPREVDGERREHHERGAQRDRVLRRAEHPKLRRADRWKPPTSPLVAEERHDDREVVEHVEARPGLDDREDRHDRAPGDEAPREEVGVVEPPHAADGQVQDDDEAEEEHQRLVDLRGRLATRAGVHDDRRDGAAEDDCERRLEAGPAESDARIDEQRADPADDEQRDHEAVELELERQVRRQRVPADRERGG